MKRLTYLFVAALIGVSAIFVFGRVVVPYYEALDLIVVQYQPSLSKIQWSSAVGSIVELDQATRRQAERGLPGTGLLSVVRELRQGNERSGTPHIIFVVSHVPSRGARLPLPRNGTVVFVQGADDTWSTVPGSAVMSGRHVIVSKGAAPSDIRIEAESFRSGTIATEVSLDK